MKNSHRRLGGIAFAALLGLIGSCSDGPAGPGGGMPGPTEIIPLRVEGADLGILSQSLVVTREGRAVTDAVVTINGVTIPHAGYGHYEGLLAEAITAGSSLDLRVNAGAASLQGTGIVPGAPVLTRPATGAAFEPAATFPVNWTSASDPDRFVVVATWIADGEAVSKSFEAKGTARQLSVFAGQFPAETEVTLAVYARNDGIFSGAADPASRLTIRGPGSSDAVVTRAAPPPLPLRITAYMDSLNQFITVSRAAAPVADAVVTVNGVPIPFSYSYPAQALYIGGSVYEGRLPAAAPAGSMLVLEVSTPDLKVQATGIVPEGPVLTAPAAGAIFASTDTVSVSWTSSHDVDHFEVFVVGDAFWGLSLMAPGTARELKIAASDIGWGNASVGVIAYDLGSYSGLVTDSQMTIRTYGPVQVPITLSP